MMSFKLRTILRGVPPGAVCAGLLLSALAAPLPALTGSEKAWFEKTRLLMTPDERKEYAGHPARVKAGFWSEGLRARIWPDATPEERERAWMKRVEFAGEAFGGESWETSDGDKVEPKGWETQRGLLFALLLGPPEVRYVGEETPPKDELEISTLEDLQGYLRDRAGRTEHSEEATGGMGGLGGLGGLGGGGGLGGLSLSGGEKTTVEHWVYPAGGGEVRVLTFTDKGGQMALVSDETERRASLEIEGETTTFADADDPWFPRSSALAQLGEPPALSDPAEAAVRTYLFRASGGVPGAVHVRTVVALDPDELEAKGLKVKDLLDGEVWVSVRRSGEEMRVAGKREPITDGLMERGDPIVLEIPLELRPGTYDLEVVVAADDKGAVGKTQIDVRDLESGLAVSDVVLTTSVDQAADKSLSLPRAETRVASKAGGPARDEEIAFHYGDYRLVPEVDGELSTEDVLAIYFQVYGPNEAEISYDIYFDGAHGGSWESQTYEPGKGSIARMQPLTGFPSADYEIRVTVKDKETGDEVQRSVTFEIP